MKKHDLWVDIHQLGGPLYIRPRVLCNITEGGVIHHTSTWEEGGGGQGV